MNKPVDADALKNADAASSVADALSRDLRASIAYRVLEPRMAFDAALAVTAATVVNEPQAAAPPASGTAEAASAEHIAQLAGALASSAQAPAADISTAAHDIVFVDTAVSNYQTLLASVPSTAEIALIDSGADGVHQMATFLAGRTGIESVHIISHGEEATLYLGTSTVTSDTLKTSYSADLAVIKAALSDNADILLYGCDIAKNADGDAFMKALSDSTGADVAASTNLTGGSESGGDWVLEATSGSIEAKALSNPLYAGLLSKTNTGNAGATWSISGQSATNTTDGVLTTVTFTNGTGAWSSISNQTLNNIAAFDNSAQNTGSLGATWGTAAGQTGTITIAFNKEVTNPELHLDRLGGNSGSVAAGFTSNSALWTLATANASLVKVTGTASFVVDTVAGTIQRAVDQVVGNGTESTIVSTGTSAGTAAGTVRIVGTFTSITFNITAAASTTSFGGDGVEIAFAIDAPPAATNDTFTTAHDAPVTINVRANDTDPRSDAISVTKVAGTSITDGGPGVPVTDGVVRLVSGNLVFTPTANYAGSTSFTYTIADANGGTSTATVSGTVTNTAPVLDLDYQPIASTPGITTPAAAANILTNGSFESGATGWTSNSGLEVSSTVATYGIPAPVSGNGTFFNELEAAALSPTSTPATIQQTMSTVTGETYVWQVYGTTRTNTSTGNDQITVTAGTTTSSTLVLARNTWSQFTGVFTAATAADIFKITAVGSTGTGTTLPGDGSGELLDNISVQKLASADAQATNNRATITTTAAQGLLANDSNLVNSATALSVTAVNGVTASVGSTITLASGALLKVNSDGSYTYNPNGQFDWLAAGATTTDSFTYTMNDGDGNTATATATITIAGLTDSAAGRNYSATYKENAAAVAIASANTMVGDADDINMEQATVTLTNPQAGDRMLVNGTTTTTGTLAGGAITYVINGSTVSLTGTATKAQYASALQAIGFDNTTDTPSTTARIINVTVNDGSANSNTATATISIDLAPDPVNDTATTNEDTAVTGNVLTNDLDMGTTPVIASPVSIVTGPAHGTLTTFNTATGAFTYTPTANYNGTDTFTYRVTDANGDTKDATVTITVNPVNDAPVNSLPAAQTTNEDTAKAITGISVNDVDGAGVTLTTTLSLPAGVGTLKLASNTGVVVAGDGTNSVTITGTATVINAAMATVIYTPLADWNGATTLTVSTSDGIAPAVSNTVAITVTPIADIANDAVTTNEDTPVTFEPFANDSFENPLPAITAINGATISAGGPGVPVTGGAVTLDATGKLTFTPTPNYNGAPSFTYTVTSGGVTETATVNMTVTPVNDAPVNTLPGAQTTNEDTTKIITGASVADVDGNSLTTTLTLPAGTGILSVVTGGGATISGNGSAAVTVSGSVTQVNAAIASITYTPAADYNGAADISVATSDGLLTTSGTISLTVTPVADITNDAVSTNEDTAKTFNVLSGTSGASADNFESPAATVTSVTQPANGTATFAANGAVTYTPNANFNGTDSFTYTVTSGGVIETATVTVTVSAVNDAPVNTLPGAQTTNEDTSVIFSASTGNAISVADVDSNVTTTLTFANAKLTLGSLAGVTVTGNGTSTVTVSGTPAAVTAALDGLTLAPAADWNGATSLSVSTSDGVAPAVVSTVAVTVTPVADINPDGVTAAEDTARTFNVLSNDSFENGGALVSSVTQPAHGTVTIGTGGNVTYTPTANYNGGDSFTYTVTSGGVTETTTVTLTVTPVNDAPTATNIFARSSVDGAAATYSVAGFFADVDGDALTFAATGLPPGLAMNPATGQIAGTLDKSASTGGTNGVYSVSVTASDPFGASVTRTFSWTVTNPAPVAGADAFTGSEDTPISGNVLVNDSDPDGDTLSVVTTPVSGPAHGTLVLNANGTFTYTPAANYNGPDGFTYTLRDADGATSTASVTLTVNPVNDTPAISAPTSMSSNEDTALAFNGANAITISDPDAGQSNTTSIAVTNGTLTLGAHANVTISGSGTGMLQIAGLPADVTAALADMTYQAPADYNGPATLTVTTTDGTGTNSQAIALTVAPVADITPDSIAATEDASISFNVLTGTNGATADSFESPSAAVTSVTQPAHGSVTIGAGGVLTYTPAADYNGSDSFTYTVTSGGVTETTTVSVTVAAVNDAPTQVLPPAQTGTEDLNVVFSGAKGNQIVIGDVDSASVTTTMSVPLGTLTAIVTPGVTISGNGTGALSLTGSPAAITAALNGLIYAPVADYNGSVSLSVSTTDGVAAPISGTIQLSLAAVADIADDIATTNEDTAVNVAVNGNDSFENPGAAVTAVTNGAHGTVVINANGTLTYTPEANYNGTNSFSYTVTSGGVSETATVTVTIAAVNDAPVTSVPPAQTVAEDGTLVFDTTHGNAITVADVDSSVTTTLSVTNGILNLSAVPGVTISGDGTGTVTVSGTPAAVTAALNGLAYHPTADYNGAAALTVTTSDGALVDSKTVNLTVTPVVDIAGDSILTNEDTAITVNVMANDSFENGAAAITAVTQGSHGSVSIGASGQLTYTPDANYNGADSFTYTVTSGGVTETTTVSVAVAAVNDASVLTVPAGQTTAEDTNLVLSAANGNAITISDIDAGDTISVSLSAANGKLTLGSTAGLATVAGDGTAIVTLTGSASAVTAAMNGLIYKPTADYNGAGSISVTASDGTATSSSTIAVNITPVADIVADTLATSEETPITFNVMTGSNGAAADNFESPGAIVSSITQPAHGTASYLSNGSFVYTPDALFSGTDTFTYTVASGGVTETTTVIVNVAHVNHAPTTSGIANQSSLDGAAIALNVAPSFADVDATDTLAYAITAGSLPAGLTLNAATGLISGTIDHDASQAGPYSITVTASDGHGGSVSSVFTWTVTNPGPTAVNDTVTTAEDTSATIAVLANDTDPDHDPLIVVPGSVSAGNGTVVVNPDNTITYTPSADFNGTDTIVYTVSDGNGGFSTASISVTVTAINDAPTTAGLSDLTDSHGFTLANIDVSNAFSDVDHDTLTFSVNPSTPLPPGVSMDANGVISGTPTTDGDYPVTVVADDGHGGIVSASFTWKIVNIPPTANDDTVSTDEDVPVVITPLANDSDPQGDPIHITTINGIDITTAPGNTVATAHGLVLLTSDAFGNDALIYTPDANFNGVETIVYGIADDNTGADTAVINITVNPVNDAPTATALADLVNSDADAVSFGVAPFFHDTDAATNGDTLTFAAVGLPQGVAIDPLTGVLSGTIDSSASQSGPYTVVITATDSAGAQGSQTFTWTVSNPPPTAVADTNTLTEGADVSVNAASGLIGNDTDPDHDALTIAAVGGNAAAVGQAVAGSAGGLFTVNADGSYVFNQNGAFEDLQSGETRTTSITYTLSDGNGGTATATLSITVNGVNDAPVATPLASIATIDGAPLTLNAGAAFSDAESDALTFSIDPAHPLPAGLSINANTGVISGTIDTSASQGGAHGVYTVTVMAADGHGGVTPVSFTISVTNPAPIAGDDSVTTLEDTPVTASVAGNDSDPDGDALTWAKASDPTHGTLVFNVDGTYTYTPDGDYNGSDSFTYTVTDADGVSLTRTVSITIGAVNDAPVAGGPVPPQTVSDGDAINASITGLFTDVDGDHLTYSVTGLPAGVHLDPSTGQVTGTIDRSASQVNGGHYTVVYTATDPSGASASVSIDVTVLNPAPTSTVLPNGTAIDSANVAIPTASAFLDPDGDPLSYSASGLLAGLVIDPATGIISGALSKDASIGGPASDGIYTIVVTASDGQGGSTSQAFAYSVANPQPAALNDAFSGSEDAPLAGTIAGNDYDPDGDGVSFQLVSGPAHGTILFNADGTFIYTPDANSNIDTYGSPDTFVYRITDANGASATATASLTISPVNDAPGPDNSAIGGPEDLPITGLLPSNDADGDIVSFTLSNPPTHGTITIGADGSYIYTPDASFNGTDSFVVLLDDGNGGQTLQTVSVIVTPVNDPPVAADQSIATNEDAAVSATLPVATDVDGDHLTYALGGMHPAHGAVTVNPDGTYTYTPAGNYNGPDSFTYTVTDGVAVVEKTVTVTVVPVNDLPVAIDQAISTSEDTAISTALPVAADIDGDHLTYAAGGTPPAHGSVTINPDGTYAYTPAANYNGPDTFTYTVTDGTAIIEKTVAVTVIPVNDAPVAHDDTASVLPGKAVIIPVLANDTDVDGDALTITSAASPDGIVTVNADGTLTFTPKPGFAGDAVITYTISDGHGGSSTATVSVKVAPEVHVPAGDAPRPTTEAARVPSEPIAMQGAVIEAVGATGLGGVSTSVDANGIVISSVNGAQSLGGLGNVDTARGAVAGEVMRISRLQALTQALTDGRILHAYDVRGLTGFSLRFGQDGSAANASGHSGDLVFETLVRDRTLILQLSDTFRIEGRTVIEYRAMQADGRPLPDWLEFSGASVLVGERPANVDKVGLRITARLSDGTTVTREVEIEATSGAIRPLDPMKRSDLPEFFSRKLKIEPMLSVREVEHLGRALAR